MKSRRGVGRKGLLPVLLVVVLTGTAALLLASPSQANAAGGSRTVLPTSYVSVAANNVIVDGPIANVIQNDYILIPVGFAGTSQTVSGISDSTSGATKTSWTKVASSDTNDDVELWCGQFIAASGSDTITVTTSANAAWGLRVIIVSGLTGCSGATKETNSGTASNPSVASFTPATGAFCEAVVSEATGTGGVTWSDSNPFLAESGGGAPASANPSGNNYVVDAFRGAWNANDGATTGGGFTPSGGVSGSAWDELFACMPTASAGDEIYNQQGFRGGPRVGSSSGNTPNEGVDAIMKGDYDVQLTFIGGTSITVSGVTDALGAGDTYTKAVSSDTNNDVEIWLGQAQATSPSGYQVTSSTTGVAGYSAVTGWNIGSISSTTAQVVTSASSGTSSGTGTIAVSVPSFTPNADDLCIEAATISTGSGSSTFATPANQPFQSLGGTNFETVGENPGGGNPIGNANLYAEAALRADWPAGVSTTGSINVAGAGNSVTVSWDVVIVCFPGTVIVPLTCTTNNGAAAATLTLSESSGNSLSPTSVTCNGVAQSITVDPSVTLTATEPTDGANTRYRFTGGASAVTDSVCASSATGSCAAWSFTNYEELSNTYQASDANSVNWDAGLSAPITGTLVGTAGTTICTITPTSGGTATASCTGWSDYNRPVTFPSTLTGAPANSQWKTGGSSPPTPTTGGNTYTANYYKQLLNTYAASPSAPGTFTGSITFPVKGTSLGAAGSSICTISVPASPSAGPYSCSGYADYNTAVSMPATPLGTLSNLRWEYSSSGLSFSDTTGGNTHTVNYYEQLLNTYQASPSVPSTWDATGPSIDSHSITNCGSTSPCMSATFSTSRTNDIIVVMVSGSVYQLPTVSISDSAGLTWHNRISGGCSWSNNYHAACEYWALASSTLSNDQITLTWGNCGGCTGPFAYGMMAITGANTVTPFDPNSAEPAVNTNEAPLTSGVATCTMSTNNANDLLIGFNGWNYGTSETVPPGWTSLDSSGSQFFDGYDFVAATLSSQVQTWVGLVDGYQTLICDAIQDSISPIAVTGTYLGSPAQTVCVMPGPSPGSSASLSCSGWADYDLPVTMGVLTVSANERWSPLTLTYTDSGGGNTHADNYYEQLQNTFQATPNAQSTWDSGLTAQGVVGTLLGSSGQTICSITLPGGGGAQSCTAYADYNRAVVIGSATISGAPANSQWLRNGACSFSQTTGGNTNNCNYYKQWTEIWQATANGQTTFDSGLSTTVSGSVLGVSATSICTITPSSGVATGTCSGYIDNAQAATFSTTMSGALPNSRWICTVCTTAPQTSGGLTVNINYFKQFSNGFAYSVTDGGSPTAPALTCTQFGSNVNCGTLSTTSAPIWVDSGGSYSATNPTTGSTGSERWDSNSPSGTVSSGGGAVTVLYYHQFLQTLSYSVLDGGSPASPAASGLQFGSAYAPSLTGAATGYWYDAIGSVAFTNPIAGASNERWDSAVSSIAATSSASTALTYYHQYQNKYTFLPAAPSTWDNSFSPTVTGTELGVAGSTICAVSLVPGGGKVSCTAYSDSGLAASFPSTIADGSNMQWTASGIVSFTDSSGGNAHTVNYYEQLQNAYQAVPNARPTFDGAYSVALTGTSLGVSASIICTITTSNGGGTASCSGLSDYSTQVSMGLISGAPPNTKWQQTGTAAWTDIAGGNNHPVNFYDQTTNTYNFVPAAPTAWDNSFSPTITGTLLGVSGSIICTPSLTSGGGAAGCSGYSDYNTAASFPASISDGAQVQWTGAAPLSFTDTTGGNTHMALYFLQYSGLTFTADPSAPSMWDSGLSIPVTGSSLGVFGTLCTISTISGGGSASCSSLSDAGTTVSFSNPIADGASVRWDTGQATWTPGAGSTTTANYFLQLQDTYQATPEAQLTWDAGLTAPSVTGTVLGVGSTSVCTITLTSGGGAASCSGWADYNLPVSLGAIGGAPANSRWEARGATSFTDGGVGGNTYAVDYYKQYTLTVVGGNGILYSVPSQTGDNYWDSGTALTVSSNGVYDRVAGTGLRVASWNLDGGSNTNVGTTGTVTTSSITMSAAHAVTFNSVTQYQLTLDAGATNALASVTPPTVSGDNYWYDSGTPVTLTLDGVYGRSGGTGARLSSYAVNGGASTPVSTIGTVTVLGALSISSAQSITTTTVTQYQVTFNAAAGSALVSCTAPTITGDNYWYDSGTSSVSCTLNGVYGRGSGTGIRVASYNWDGGANTNEATTGTFTTSPQTMSATHQLDANPVTQYEVTLDSGATGALASITPSTISGDNYWYDSGTQVTLTLNGVYGRSGGTGTRLSSYAINGGAPTPVSTTGTVTVLNASPIAGLQSITTITVNQYQLTLASSPVAGGTTAYVTNPTIAGDTGWYDTSASVQFSATPAFDYGFSLWQGTGGCSDSSSSNPDTITLTCAATETALFTITTVQQPIVLDISLVGAPIATFTISGCGPSPATVVGDGPTSHTISMSPSCAFTITIVNGGTIRYGFSISGSFSSTSPNEVSCASGTCGTITLTYYYQLQNTFQITSNAQPDFDNGLSSLTVSGAQLGSAANLCSITVTVAPSDSCANVWSDWGAAATFPQFIGGAGANIEWQNGAGGPSSTPPITTGGGSFNANYWKQWQPTLQIDANSQGSFDASMTLILTGPQLGVPGQTICTINTGLSPEGTASCSTGWVDNDGAVTFAAALTGAPSNTRWENGAGAPSTVTVTGASPAAVNYWKQASEEFAYSISGGGAGYSAPSLTCDQLGSPSNCATLSLSVTAYWLDFGSSWSATNPLSGSGSSERWVSSSASGVSSAGGSVIVAYVHQFSLTVIGGNGITYSIPSETGDNFWNAGDSPTVSSNGVWDRVGGTGQRVASWNIDGGPDNLVATAGTVPTSPITMSAAHTVTFNDVTQYRVALDPGATAALSSITPPTVSGDNYWYDSGTSVTLSLNGVWGRTAATGNRLTLYTINGGVPTMVATTGLVGVLSALPLASPQSITTTTAVQYFLDVSGGNGVTYSVAPPIPGDTGWYDSGTSLTVSTNRIYDRAAGTGQRVTSWNLDGGTNNAVAAVGTVTTSPITMSASHAVVFNSVTQYELSLDGGATSALASITSPTNPADDYWYDSGTSVTLTLNGAFGRGGGVGTRLTGYEINGGASTPVSTTGPVTVLNSVTIASPQAVTTTTVAQFEVSLDGGAVSALQSITPPKIPGDNYWYDSGTSVTLTLNGVFGRGGGTGSRLAGYSVNGGANNPTSTLGIVTVLSALPIESAQSITTEIVTQYQLTLTVSPAAAGNAIYETPTPVPGDAGWYDSGTTISFSVTGNPGYNFGRWIGSGVCSYTGNQLATSVLVECAVSEEADFSGFAVQPIVLQGTTSPGAIPEFSVTGCHPAPSLILGDGNMYSVQLDRSCAFTISIINSGPTRYGFSLSGEFSSTSPTETSCATGTCSTITLTYYEQVSEQFAFSTSDGASGYSAPTLTCVQLGSPGACGGLTPSPVSYWLDYGGSWSATNPLPGSSGAERWESASSSGVTSAPASITVAYVHQYTLSFAANPQGGGTTIPLAGTSEWVNAGTGLAVSASPSAGFGFASWTTTNPGGIAFSNATAASTTVTVNGAGVATAGFNTLSFAVTFFESGLPPGMTWSVTVNGQTASSNSSTLVLDLGGGSYLWNVSSPIGGPTGGVRYIAPVSSGQLTVTGPTTQAVAFVTQYYLTVSVASTASGIALSPSSGWYDAGTRLEMNASVSPTVFMAFVSWTGTGSGSYTGPNAAAPLTMNGLITETASFVAETGTVVFIESGLPQGAEWSVVVNGVNQTTTGDSITFNGFTVGSMVDWTVQSATSQPETGSLQVVAPETITVTITFTTIASTVTSTLTTTVTSSTTSVSQTTTTSTVTSTIKSITTSVSTVSTGTTIYSTTTTTSTFVLSSYSSAYPFILFLLALLLALALLLGRRALRGRKEMQPARLVRP